MDHEGAAGGADPYRERGRRSNSRLLIDSYLVRCPDVNRSLASGPRYEVPCHDTEWPVVGTGGEARIHASEGRPRWANPHMGPGSAWTVVDKLGPSGCRIRRLLGHGCGGVVGGGMRVGGATLVEQ